MPRGPKGEKRTGDVIGAAIMVGRIATGEIEEPTGKAPNRAKGGRKGAKVRARTLTSQERSDIARAAASARWRKSGT
ncbi:hypothetical protein ACVJGD_009188 [Bradyrhizobium sp. USDA 10063]